MHLLKRTLSILLSVILIFSIFTIIPAVSASALEDGDTISGRICKWVDGVYTDIDNTILFNDLYSNVTFYQSDAECEFDYTDPDSTTFYHTGDMESSDNICIITYDEKSGETSAEWDNSEELENGTYLIDHTEKENENCNWYAYTWEDDVTLTYTAAVNPAYDANEECPYINGHTAYYAYDNKFFSKNEDGTYSEISESSTVVPYFEFKNHGSEESPLIKLEKCNSTDKDIIVPETVPASYPDEALRSLSFSIIAEESFAELTTLENIEMGDNINYISGNSNSLPGAFYGCTNLKTVTVGSYFNYAYYDCFDGCTSLTTFKTTSIRNDGCFFDGIKMIANDNKGLKVICYHSTKLYYDLYDNEYISFEFLDSHTYTPTWDWRENDGELSAGLSLNCSHCNFVVSDIPAEISTIVIKEPTCTEDGIGCYKATAEYDGQTFTDTDSFSHTFAIPAEHNFEHYAYTEATDVEDGNIEYWKCTQCGKYFIEENGVKVEVSESDVIIPAKNTIKKGLILKTGTEMVIPEGTKILYFASNGTITYSGMKTFESRKTAEVTYENGKLMLPNAGTFVASVRTDNEDYSYADYYYVDEREVTVYEETEPQMMFVIEPVYLNISETPQWTWSAGLNPSASAKFEKFSITDSSDFISFTDISLSETVQAEVVSSFEQESTIGNPGQIKSEAKVVYAGHTFTDTQYSTYDSVKTLYKDENGEDQYVYALQITDNLTSLSDTDESGGWYFVSGDITALNEFSLDGDINIILTDDCLLCYYYLLKNSTGNISFYCQNENFKGSADISYISCENDITFVGGIINTGGVYADGSMTLSDGYLNINDTFYGIDFYENFNAVKVDGDIIIKGGKLTTGKDFDTSAYTDTIEIGNDLTITGGTVITKEIHTEGNILVSGGSLTADSRTNDELDAQSPNAITSKKDITFKGGEIKSYGNSAVITLNGTITISGGNVQLSGYGAGLFGNNINISGGNVNTSASDDNEYGIFSYNDITLSWSDKKDSIYSSGYYSSSSFVLFDKVYKDEFKNYYIGDIGASSIANLTLIPYFEIFKGHSLTLDGKIGINYFLDLTQEDIDMGTTVSFSWNSLDTDRTASYTVTADDYITELGYYKATCYVAAAEMTCDITASCTIGVELQDNTDTYSVYKYGNVILSEEFEKTYTDTDYKQLSDLVKSMLSYGSKAQKYFNCNTDTLADKELVTDDTDSNYYYNPADISADDITSKMSDNMDIDAIGIKFSGASVMFLTDASLRLYYSIDDPSKYTSSQKTFTFGGDDADMLISPNHTGIYFFQKENIAPADFDRTYTLHLSYSSTTYGYSSTEDRTYSILDYVKACLKSETVSGSMKDLAKAKYYYNLYADAYFTE